jgi:uncharacterized protein (TIGR02118 family)
MGRPHLKNPDHPCPAVAENARTHAAERTRCRPEGALVANAKLIVLYPPPADVKEFERAYFEEHVPMMRDTLSGARALISHITDAAVGPSPYHLCVEIYGESTEAIKSFLSTPDGQKLAGHAVSISTGGPPTLLFSEEDSYQL